jgi:hypothetical protein
MSLQQRLSTTWPRDAVRSQWQEKPAIVIGDFSDHQKNTVAALL